MSIVSYQKRNYRSPYFHKTVEIISENSLYKLRKAMYKKETFRCASIVRLWHYKANVIEMTICVHTVNGVIRIKIEHVLGMITSY